RVAAGDIAEYVAVAGYATQDPSQSQPSATSVTPHAIHIASRRLSLSPAYHMSRELPAERQALPLFKVLYRNSSRIQDAHTGLLIAGGAWTHFSRCRRAAAAAAPRRRSAPRARFAAPIAICVLPDSVG